MRSHLPCSNPEGLVAKDVRDEEVNSTEDQGQDTGADDDAPGGAAEGFLGCSGFVQVSEDGDAEDYH